MRDRATVREEVAVPPRGRSIPEREREGEGREPRERNRGGPGRRGRSPPRTAPSGRSPMSGSTASSPSASLPMPISAGGTTRRGRAVNRWVRAGLAREFAGKDADGAPYALFSATVKGAAVLRDLAGEQGIDPGQRFTHTHRFRRDRLGHDTAIYRVARRERERLALEDARVRRVRLEAELMGTVYGRSEAARRRLGPRAADAERHAAATELGLPIDPEGCVRYPDLQIEYVDAAGEERPASMWRSPRTATARSNSAGRSRRDSGSTRPERGPSGWSRACARAGRNSRPARAALEDQRGLTAAAGARPSSSAGSSSATWLRSGG